ncbi:hypothetical protein C8R43DRAFT_497364 [Mycena crocata]|nr:hypothetical protein C8R43DRAFT_497364 [Mycena crocata]
MDSLPEALLGTNTPPTDPQIEHIRQLLLERQTLAQDLAHQCYSIRASLDLAEARQNNNNSEIEALQAIISPARRIPRDILVEVFKFCVDNSIFGDDKYSINDPKEAPLVLSRVCALWRDVALHTPRLWNRLTFYFPESSVNIEGTLIRQLVHRSHPHCLDVVIKADYTVVETASMDLLQRLAGLAEFCDRVGRLRLDLYMENIHPLLEIPNLQFPNLQELVLDIGSSALLPAPLRDILEFFKDSPSPFLTQLQISSSYLDNSTVSTLVIAPHFPWARLTNLCLSLPLDFLQARVVLTGCTSLRECKFTDLVAPCLPQPDIVRRHTLPELRKLTVTSSTIAPSHPFFEELILPNIVYLEFDVWAWSIAHLLALVTRSRFKLSHLSLRGVGLPAAGLAPFLEANPTVTHFSIFGLPDQSIIGALAYDPSQHSVLLPQLTDISIETAQELSTGGQHLINMLQSRWDLTRRTSNTPPFSRLLHARLLLPSVDLSAHVREALGWMQSVGLVKGD